MTRRSPCPTSKRRAEPPLTGRSSSGRGVPSDRIATIVSCDCRGRWCRRARPRCLGRRGKGTGQRSRTAPRARPRNGASSASLACVRSGSGKRLILAVEAQQAGHVDNSLIHSPPLRAPRHCAQQPLEELVGAAHPGRPEVDPGTRRELGPPDLVQRPGAGASVRSSSGSLESCVHTLDRYDRNPKVCSHVGRVRARRPARAGPWGRRRRSASAASRLRLRQRAGLAALCAPALIGRGPGVPRRTAAPAVGLLPVVPGHAAAWWLRVRDMLARRGGQPRAGGRQLARRLSPR